MVLLTWFKSNIPPESDFIPNVLWWQSCSYLNPIFLAGMTTGFPFYRQLITTEAHQLLKGWNLLSSCTAFSNLFLFRVCNLGGSITTLFIYIINHVAPRGETSKLGLQLQTLQSIATPSMNPLLKSPSTLQWTKWQVPLPLGHISARQVFFLETLHQTNLSLTSLSSVLIIS